MKRYDVTGSSGDSKLLRRATKNVMLLKDYLQPHFGIDQAPRESVGLMWSRSTTFFTSVNACFLVKF